MYREKMNCKHSEGQCRVCARDLISVDTPLILEPVHVLIRIRDHLLSNI